MREPRRSHEILDGYGLVNEIWFVNNDLQEPSMSENRPRRTFTFREAQELLPKVQEITKDAVEEAQAITAKMNDLDDNDDRSQEELEKAYVDIMNNWATKVLKLGCEVKGPWLVDFDSGHGYFCWKHPEPILEHFHGYQEGFAGRSKIL
jgi:hypothetical protein